MIGTPTAKAIRDALETRGMHYDEDTEQWIDDTREGRESGGNHDQ